MNVQTLKIDATSKSLIALTSLCLTMTVFRLIMQQDILYLFLVFNLFLAWITYILSQFALNIGSSSKSKTYLLLAFWLLFFPNAPYIITDLLHFKDYAHNILWFDALLVFVYAITGLLLGAHSLWLAQQSLHSYFSKNKVWTIVIGVIFLSGFGIYLGRFCRLNSWDMFHSPIWFIGRVLHQFVKSTNTQSNSGLWTRFFIYLPNLQ